jgi:hypothetical protein
MNSPSRPPLDMNPNVALCQIHTFSICEPKKLFFLDFRALINNPKSTKFSDNYPDLATVSQIW